MEDFTPEVLRSLYKPPSQSHKGQNGKLLIIGGSKLFHAASLWSLKVASRIVDLVHYASVLENNVIVSKLKEEFRDGIVIARGDIDAYIEEDDCVLLGPGMIRADNDTIKKFSNVPTKEIFEIEKIGDEGVQTYFLTKYLLGKYPQKKWVIDAGALQMLELSWIPKNAILTPHHGEFDVLKSKMPENETKKRMNQLGVEEQVPYFAQLYRCTVILKGEEDIVCSWGNPNTTSCVRITGGNAGMTKGGTGDVLAGLVAGLYAKNDPFLAASAAAYIHKQSGEDLYKRNGYYFNASDLTDQIPQTMKRLIVA